MNGIEGVWRFRKHGEIAPEGSMLTSAGWLVEVPGPAYRIAEKLYDMDTPAPTIYAAVQIAIVEGGLVEIGDTT